MRSFVVFLLLLLSGWVPALAADAAANKALFDRTVDRLNLQTMEGVYDARFARKKFPAGLLTRADRRAFKDFNGDAGFEKLFLNYNDEAEKYKGRFGNGPATLAAFEKGLRGILLDANFEFFLAKAARREDRAALIRKLEGTIKQAVAQYDASGEDIGEARQPDTLAGATIDEDDARDADESPADASEAQVDALNQTATPTPDAVAPATGPAPAAGGGWRATLTLLLALGAAGGVAYLLFVVVPALRAQTPRPFEGETLAVPVAPDDHLPPTLAEEARHRAVELRFELLADEVDELKGRIRELELRLADALAAPPEADAFGAAELEPVAFVAAPALAATMAVSAPAAVAETEEAEEVGTAAPRSEEL